MPLTEVAALSEALQISTDVAKGLKDRLWEHNIELVSHRSLGLKTKFHDDCYFCGRPENLNPFLIPGTPIELFVTESDAGRWRQWATDDIYRCGEHLDRGEFYGQTEIGEHLIARHGYSIDHLDHAAIQAAQIEYEAEHAKALRALDKAAPKGGVIGVKGEPNA